MKFVPKKTKEKEPSTYKTLYLKENLVKDIEKIAKENNTSFNNEIIFNNLVMIMYKLISSIDI